MKKMIFLLVVLISKQTSARSFPIKYEGMASISSFTYNHKLVDVDPGPGWRGDYPPEDKTGIQISFTNGIKAFKRWHAGVMTTYANYDGTSGFIVSGLFSVDAFTGKFTPVPYFNVGYSHFWNQYPGGTGTGLVEGGIGFRYKLKGKKSLMLSIGSQAMQHDLYTNIRASFSF